MINPKEIIYGSEARKSIMAGIDKLADAVKVTLGPCGRTVIIKDRYCAPRVTKDGVTVAKAISFSDEYENTGAELIKLAAVKTMETVGDGTTTSTVLTQYLCRGALELVEAEKEPVFIKKGFQLALDRALTYLDTVAIRETTPEALIAIGTISANGDKAIGTLLAEVVSKIGKDGGIQLERGYKEENEVIYTEGMTFSKGYISDAFINVPSKMSVELDNPVIFLSENIYTHALGLAPVFKAYLEIFQKENRPLLIICNDVQNKALEHLINNKNHPTLGLPIVAVAAPFQGKDQKDFLTDLEVITGATCFRMFEGKTLDKCFKAEHFGNAKRVVINAKTTTISVKQTDPIGVHVKKLKELLEDRTSNEEALRMLGARIARLTTGIATIRVGGVTEADILERKDRIEDAMYAVRAAVAEGYVAGGGSELLRARQALIRNKISFKVAEGDAVDGYRLFCMSLSSPLTQLEVNSSTYVSAQDRLLIESNPGTGYNFLNNEYCNMLEKGIIDPVSVLKAALIDAVSVTNLVLSTEAVISEKELTMSQRQGPQVVRVGG